MNNTDDYPWQIVKHYVFDIVLFLCMVGIIALASMAALHTWGGRHDWLQRSGAAVIVLALIIDYRHFHYYQGNSTHQSVISGALHGVRSMRFLALSRYYIGLASIAFIAIGTIASGFGDLAFRPCNTINSDLQQRCTLSSAGYGKVMTLESSNEGIN